MKLFLIEFWNIDGNDDGGIVKANDKAETIYEISDLAYHVMVLMVQMGISLEDIRNELASRHVIDHKVKQEKMTK